MQKLVPVQPFCAFTFRAENKKWMFTFMQVWVIQDEHLTLYVEDTELTQSE